MSGGAKTRAWAEIDLGALVRNSRAIRAHAGGRRMIAVVKADAYGHGAVPVARALRDAGADWLAVADIEEGIELRESGDRGRILVFGALRPRMARAR